MVKPNPTDKPVGPTRATSNGKPSAGFEDAEANSLLWAYNSPDYRLDEADFDVNGESTASAATRKLRK